MPVILPDPAVLNGTEPMPAMANDPVQIGDWLVDPRDDSLARGSERVKIEPRTMRLLMRLAQSPGTVISQEELLESVWTGVVVGTASIYQSMSQLRKALGDTDDPPRYIETVARKGYRLVAPVSVAPPAARPPSPAPELAAAPSPAAKTSAQPGRTPGLDRHRGGFCYRGHGRGLAIRPAIPGRAADGLDRGAAFHRPHQWQDRTGVLRWSDRGDFQLAGADPDVARGRAHLGILLSRPRSRRPQDRARANISHVVEGSLRRSGDRMRITVQLIDTHSGYHLWSGNYDVEAGDVLRIQEDVARAVAGNLELRITPETDHRFAGRRSANSEAQRSI